MRTGRSSRLRVREDVHVADGLEPLDVPGARALVNFANELDDVWLVAGFRRIIGRYHRLHLKPDGEAPRVNPSRLSDSATFDLHDRIVSAME